MAMTLEAWSSVCKDGMYESHIYIVCIHNPPKNYHKTILLVNSAESESENDTGPLMRNAACQWSPQPEMHTNVDSDSKSYDDATKEAVLGS